jgi:RHS repeat-associated protein
VSTLAQLSQSGSAGIGPGFGTFGWPSGIAVALSTGTVYLADPLRHRIHAVTATGTTSIFAGSGQPGSIDGSATTARFRNPSAVAYDASRLLLYVADSGSHKIRKIAANGAVSTLAGSGTPGYANGTGTAARFSLPTGLALDRDGNVYVSDTLNQRIRKITPAGVVTTLAGSGVAGFADSAALQARFSFPIGIAAGDDGSLYIADSLNRAVRKIAGGAVSTVVRNAPQLLAPVGLDIENTKLYITDALAHKLVRVRLDASPAITEIFAGTTIGYADGSLMATKFKTPTGLAIVAGAIYVADSGNNAVRLVKGTPALTDIYPREGPAAGGTLVRVFGTGFVAGATQVKFGSAAATNVTVAAATELLATTPAGIGTADVSVTTGSGTSTLAARYVYLAPPTVTSIQPAIGPTAGGTTITITGMNFVAGNTTIAIGGTPISQVAVASSSILTAITPPGTVGVSSLVVTTPVGTATLPLGFTYIAPPVIAGFAPASGPPGAMVNVTGANFIVGGTQVLLGAQLLAPTSVTPTQLTFVVPQEATSGRIAVATVGGNAQSATDFVVRALTSIVVTPPSATVNQGATQAFTATGHYSDGTTADLSANATWSTSNAALATVSGTGVATAVNAGTVAVSASIGSAISTAQLTILPAFTGLTITPAAVSIRQGETQAFNATASYSDGTSRDVTSTATWSSSNATVATIDQTGTARGIGTGSVTVTAAFEAHTATAQLSVDRYLTSLEVMPSALTVAHNTTEQLTATATYSDGVTSDVTSSATWSSSAPGIASVSAGTVRGEATGNATVTATLDNLADSSLVTVSGVATTLTVAPSALTLEPEQSAPLTATVTYSDGNTADVTSTAIWSSSLTAVASVSAAGLVTGVAGGVTSITASVETISGSATVTVEAASEEPLPPDPATIAPPIDPTKITTVYESTRFLYEGTPRIQTGVEPETIERLRAAVIRGRVLRRGGTPLPGVKITILDHPEYGQTLTRADGRFDLAVNGGGEFTVQYRRNGLIDLDRTAVTRWNDWSMVEDVVMIPYDAAMTVVDLAAPGVKVHRATTASDADGMRTATLLFAPGTTATMTLPDGSEQPLTTLSVRATEYTVGDDGPRAMPATLPPHSAYTYCAELSTDEAIAAGATQVNFSQPVSMYIEDFLEFGAGAVIPVGTYDRVDACWVPSKNGRVVMIVAIVEGRAYLDVDGDGIGDDSDAEIGTTISERETLATIYNVGATLWRSPLNHFSPGDQNFAMWLSTLADNPEFCTGICEIVSWDNEFENLDVEDGGSPKMAASNKNPTPDSCSTPNNEVPGSIIECTTQVLGEEIGLVGTNSMAFRTSRVPGRQTDRSITIPLSAESVPRSLKRIELAVSCAGRETVLSFPPQANLSYQFTWDGNDAYGRPVQGQVPVDAEIRYVYSGTYTVTRETRQALSIDGGEFGLFWRSFGAPLDRTIVRQTRVDVARTQSLDIKRRVGSWDARGAGLGGWTLTNHHTYDHSARTLQQGNGNRRDIGSTTPIMRLAAGTGFTGSLGDGGPANKASLLDPRTVAIGPDGSVYIGEPGRIRRIDRKSGDITTFAGNGSTTYNGANNVSPHQAAFNPTDIAVAGDGSLLIADETNGRLFRIRNGKFTLVAGNGGSGTAVDGGSAIDQPIAPHGVAAVGDCIAYIADRVANRIRRVMCDGRIYTIAGTGTYTNPLSTSAPTGGLAVEVQLSRPAYIAVDNEGRIFFSMEGNAIYRIDANGVFSRLTDPYASGMDPYGQGQPARAGGLSVVGTTIYHAHPSRHHVRRLILSSTDDVVAGTDDGGYAGDDGPAAEAQLAAPADVAVFQDRLYVADTANDRTRFIEGLMPPMSNDAMKIPSVDGTEFYVFDKDGKHLGTIDTMTGVALATFAYDVNGFLETAIDYNGNVTRIERGTNGRPVAVVAPGGQRTTFQLDENGYIDEIRNPAGEAYRFNYDDGGLLRAMTDPRSEVYAFDYDSEGRLTADQDPASGSTSLVRDDDADNFTVTRTTAEGRTATHSVNEQQGGARRAVITGFDGVRHAFSTDVNAASLSDTPRGSITALRSADPRFGFFAPVMSSSVVAPSGRQIGITESRSATLLDVDNPFGPVLNSTRSLMINGRTFTSMYEAANQTITHTSPEGRTVVNTIDGAGRLIKTETATTAPVEYFYDSRGLLERVAQGERETNFGYDLRYRLTSITDPLQRTLQFEYDNADRVIKQTLAGREVSSTYDESGNLESVKPAGRQPHLFAATPVNLEERYTPPAIAGSGETEYVYDRDCKLSTVSRPDGSSISLDYDAAGRLTTLTTGSGSRLIEYDGTTGDLAFISTPTAQSLAFGYDGWLLNSVSYSGDVSGRVMWQHNDDLAMTEETVCDRFDICQTVSFDYDADNLLRRAGNLAMSRDADGLLARVIHGGFDESWSRNEYGEIEGYASVLAEEVVFAETYTRDRTGRIVGKRVAVGNDVTEWRYDFDTSGRLVDVRRDGALATHYEYDLNSNRVAKVTPSETTYASCDGQDRITSYGGITYSYIATGELESTTDASGTATYAYDEIGNLIQVRLPDGRLVEYVVDGQNRRIGRKLDGATTQQWLYGDQLRIVAELDGAGAIVSRFVYGTRSNVPDYIVKADITYRIVSDHLGSPRLVVDVDSGTVAQRIDYDEFGIVTSDTNPGFQPFGFSGGLYDVETKLVRFGARDYDARTGRWTAKDPLLFDGRDSNLYSYVRQDPVNLIDPTGLLLNGAIDAGEGYGQAAVEQYAEILTDPESTWYEQAGAAVGGTFAALWTPCTSDKTLLTLTSAYGASGMATRAGAATEIGAARNPYWRYVGPRSRPNSPWMTRGSSPPYGTNYSQAKDALQLPNTPNAVQRVNVRWWEPVRGPRPVTGNPQWGGGNGIEYARGFRWPS